MHPGGHTDAADEALGVDRVVMIPACNDERDDESGFFVTAQ